MPLEEAMQTQRSIRRLKPDPVDDDIVLRLIELALKAPTGGNRQNWAFVVVKDRAVKERLARYNRQAFAIYGRIGRRTMRDEPGMLRVLDAVQWQADHFAEVPVVIVACLKGARPPFPPLAASSYYGSIYPSVQNLLLAARAAGLGAGVITLPLWSTFLARRALGLPWNVTPCAVVPLGWPRGRYGPTTRRPVGEIVHVDRYGNRPFR
jgi:nitroreductase